MLNVEQKEPLSRALRGRRFEHEDYMEILYPDVIGSGGAPKRIMRPRRRADGFEETEMPGTGILNLHLDPSSGQPAAAADNNRAYSTAEARVPASQSATLPARAALGQSPAVQAPSDESANQARKRALPQEPAEDALNIQPSPSSDTQPSAPQVALLREKRARTSAQGDAMSSALEAVAATVTAPSSSTTTPLPVNGNGSGLDELDAARHRLGLHWQEAALDAFFKDFGDRDPDLQLMITEAVLCDE